MDQRIQRVFPILLIVLLLLCGTAAADISSGILEYWVLDGGAVITGYNGILAKLEIPAELDGYTVREIRSLLGGDTLTRVTIPASVVKIDDNPFMFCEDLKEIAVSPDNPVFEVNGGALYNKTKKEVVAFPRASGAEHYTVPKGTESISDHAFYKCGLSTIELRSSVKTIGHDVFCECGQLTQITIPAAEFVGSMTGSFYRCDNLKYVLVPQDHPTLASVDGVLYNKKTGELVMCPAGLNMTSYTVADGTTSIGASAFSGCTRLEEVIIPDSVTTIGDRAFYDCTSIRSMDIPDSVTSIGAGAFQLCMHLGSMYIPDSVTSIGENAFEYCKSMQKVSIPKDIGDIIEKGLFDGCNSLKEIILPEDHPVYESIDGVIFNRQTKELVKRPPALLQDTYTIPSGTLSVGPSAFEDNTGLKEITIPDSVKTIGNSAFSKCNGLTSVSIPESVTAIGDEAFYSCSRLSTIRIPAGVTSIGEDVFNYCPALKEVIAESGSYAETYCKEHGLTCRIP